MRLLIIYARNEQDYRLKHLKGEIIHIILLLKILARVAAHRFTNSMLKNCADVQ